MQTLTLSPPQQMPKPLAKERILEIITETGATPFKGVQRVVFYKGDIEYVIAANQVYYSKKLDTYFFIGEIRQFDAFTQMSTLAQQLRIAQENGIDITKAEDLQAENAVPETLEDPELQAQKDVSWFSFDAIGELMIKANLSETAALDALRLHGGLQEALRALGLDE